MKNKTQETKHEKFIRLAEARTNKIIDTLRLLGNCSNMSVYEYSPEDVNQVFDAIEREIRETKKKFQRSDSERNTRFSIR